MEEYWQTKYFRIERVIIYFSFAFLVSMRVGRLGTGWIDKTALIISCLITCCGLSFLANYYECHLKRKTTDRLLYFYEAVFAASSVYGITLLTELHKGILWLILFGLLFFAAKKIVAVQTSRKNIVASGILGWLFALFILIGHECQYHLFDATILWSSDHNTLYELAMKLFSMAALGVFFSACLNLLFSHVLESDYSGNSYELKFRSFFSYTLGILLFWLPYYTAFYPGILDKDSISEVSQQLGLELVSDHHPVMHQMIIRLFLNIGKAFNNLQFGVGLYTAVQMLIMAMVFSACICQLKKYGANHGLCIVIFLCYSLFTVNGFFVITMWKDILFAGTGLLLTIMLIELLNEKTKPRLGFLLIILVTSFLYCTLRNNGFHAFVIAILIMTMINKHCRLPLVFLLLSVIILVTAYHQILFNVIGVKKTRTAMMLSIPLQQFARVVKYGNVDFNDENFTIMKEVFPEIEEPGEEYIPFISDGVVMPTVFESEVFDANPLRYMKSWLKIGVQHPRMYIEAFLLQCYGYWYPDVDNMIIYRSIKENNLGISANSMFGVLRQRILELNDELSQIQPVSALYSLALMVWLIWISGTILLLKNQKELFSPILLSNALWLTTLDSPTYCEYRYLYALVVSVPLFCALAIIVPRKRN